MIPTCLLRPALALIGALTLAAPAVSQSAAEQLLEEAAQAQLSRQGVAEVAGFTVSLNLRERGEAPREVDLKLFYRSDDGGLIRLLLDEPDRGVRVAKGFDGKTYWLKEQDKETLDLSSREFAQDREAIDEAIELSEQLLLLLDLNQLERMASDLRIKELEVPEDDAEAAARAARIQILSGRVKLGSQIRLFDLELDRQAKLAYALVLYPPPTGSTNSEAERPPIQRFELGYYKDFEGRLMPSVIQEYQGIPKPELPIRLLELHRLTWREPPARESFLARS